MSHATGLQRAAAVGVAGIAVATFTTSFHALTGLAVETGATAGWLAPMLPVALDGMVVAASMAVVASRRAGRPAAYSWFLVALYTSLSVAGNAAHAAPRGPVAALIAAAFPLTLFLSFEQLLRITTTPDHAPGRERDAETTRAAAGDAEGRVLVAGDARARVRAVWEDHREGGGDPAELTGLVVAGAAGCSVRRAQELLAELRADQPSASPTRNGHAGAGGLR